MRWVLNASIFLVLGFSATAEAAVIVNLGPPTSLNGGLIGRTVSAMGTNGEIIAGFDAFQLEYAHQVFGLGDAQTLRVGSFPGFGWDAAWEAYDSHLLIPSSQVLGSVGAALGETNSKSTTGTLELPQQFGQNAPSGFGAIKSANGTDGFRLLPEFQSSNVPFLYVVGSDSLLDVTIAYSLNGNNLSQVFSGNLPCYDCGPASPFVANLTNNTLNGTVEETIEPLFHGFPQPTWGSLVFDEYVKHPNAPNGAAGLNLVPEWDAATGEFSWNTSGSTRGTYQWHVTHIDNASLTVGKITVVQNAVPEPASAALLTLAVFAVAGISRRRLAVIL